MLNFRSTCLDWTQESQFRSPGNGARRKIPGADQLSVPEATLRNHPTAKTQPLDSRVRMWRGGLRYSLSVAVPFVWRCLNSLIITPYPHPPHRTGHADFPHPALGQDNIPSHTKGHTQITQPPHRATVPFPTAVPRYNRTLAAPLV